MKKLMLVSAFNPVSRLLPRVEPELKAKTVAFIPTASKGSLYSPIMGLAKHALRRMDVSIYSLDIASASYGLIHDVIEASDIIYVGGGNSFLLLQEMRRSGADTIITEAVTNGKPYIGESAGAVVAGPDTGTSAIWTMRRQRLCCMIHGVLDWWISEWFRIATDRSSAARPPKSPVDTPMRPTCAPSPTVRPSWCMAARTSPSAGDQAR